MDTVPDELRPEWDRYIPSRLDWELDRLREQALEMAINREKLGEGIVEIDLVWPVRGEPIALKATFPATYPFMRPHVQLRTDPSGWPTHHVSPWDGGLCLLGRDTTQWGPGDWLADLLSTQLEPALHGGGLEDPQGEPAEYWWNQNALPDSYCLVDSDWDLSGAERGTLTVRLLADRPRKRGTDGQELPAFRMVVTEVRDTAGCSLATWSGPLPEEFASGRLLSISWCRSPGTLWPKGNYSQTIVEIRRDRLGGPGTHTAIGHDVTIRPFVILHPVELTEDRRGDGWLVGLEWGPLRAFLPHKGRGPNVKASSCRIPVYRAGAGDLGARVPAFASTAGKAVVVIGVGALGAPVAIELARNGVAQLRLVDHDVVEPGNSVRWPLGASSWGQPKVEALKAHLERNYPRCSVVPRQHAIGGLGVSDLAVLAPLLEGADLVIDASASSGVNRAVWDLCQRARLPMLKLAATPDVKGGTVAVFAPGGPCPGCLDLARHFGRLEKPTGHADKHLIQPAGCGERTFVGADYDLQELSLHAMRCAVAALESGVTGSVVHTLSLRDEHGAVVAPRWVEEVLDVQPECTGHQ